MSGLVSFVIPADFVSSRVALTREELVCGYRKGWLAPMGLTELAGDVLPALSGLPAEEEMPYLLPSEVAHQVNAAVDAVELDCEDPRTNEVWSYLALAHLYERRNTVSGFFQVIEMIWSDHDYPEEMSGFIYYMPPPPGGEYGEPAMLRRLATYLSDQARRYRTRGGFRAG
ncbi:DUF2247 family protein [Sphaerisporangium corydalis]|uniref:DUF2247 family protein n=1 Tax=Sphaerisporangium corydalis TaxID=1441875 RepID=A0ABV9EN39_9ACTN|nr:DUF2247 family protein [Sphaerisporangium corydalis]